MLQRTGKICATRLAQVAFKSGRALAVGITALGFAATGLPWGKPTIQAAPPRAESMYDLEASGFVAPPTGPVPAGAFVPPGYGEATQTGYGMMPTAPNSVGPNGMPMMSPAGPPNRMANPMMANPMMGGQMMAGPGAGPMMGAPVMAGPGGGPMPGAMIPGATMPGSAMPSTMMPNSMGPGAPSRLPITAAIQQVGYQGQPYGVMPAGYSSCDAMPCMTGGCDSGCGGSCSGGCPLIRGGVLGKLMGQDCSGGCDSCGGSYSEMSNLRHICLFCSGDGCSACQLFSPGALVGALYALRPYSEQGKCAQRWYDVSVEALFLSHGSLGFGGANGGLIATDGADDPLTPALDGTPVLYLGDADPGDMTAGVRIAGSLIAGPGGAIEGIYFGGNDWSEQATASSGTANLFSFISDFGVTPAGGFDDTDQSFSQSLLRESTLHNVEINYRRRVVGPYCKFQGSWLAGIRYVNFKNSTLYSAVGEDNNGGPGVLRFFDSDNEQDNNMLGAQVGFDLWYAWMPGINIGVGSKLGWMHNDVTQTLDIVSNSSNLVAPNGLASVSDSDSQVTTMGEFEVTMLYRLTHSWTFKSSYFAMAIDDVAVSGVDGAEILDFANGNPVAADQFRFDSVVFQGFSLGAEYTW